MVILEEVELRDSQLGRRISARQTRFERLQLGVDFVGTKHGRSKTICLTVLCGARVIIGNMEPTSILVSTDLLVCQDLERCLQNLINGLSWLICVLLHKPVQRVVSFHVEHGTYLVNASSEVDDRTHSCLFRQEPHEREPESSLPQDLLRLMLSGYEIYTLLPENVECITPALSFGTCLY